MGIRGQYEEWFRAIIAGDVAKVKQGVGAGLDVDARTDRGRTAIMLAARFGHADVIDALTQAGADVDASLCEFAAPDAAPEVSDIERMESLVESAAADIPESDTAGQRLVRSLTGFISALHATGERRRAHANATDAAVFDEDDEDDGFEPHELSTALCHAAAYGHTDAARRLIVAGADVDAPRWDCTPPLVHAAMRGNLAMVGLLVGAGADPDDGFDVTPLEAAAMRGHADVLSRLLQAGATPDSMNENGQTPLMRAAECGHLTAVHVLINGGADPNVWEQGETALLCAARNAHEDVVEYLETLVSGEIREWVRIEMRER